MNTAAVVVCIVAVVGGMAVEGTETLCWTVVVVVVVGAALVGSAPLVEGHPWDSSVCTLGLPLEEGQQTWVVAVVSSGEGEEGVLVLEQFLRIVLGLASV